MHVSDPAASILSDSPADLEARGRGETLYLPEACYRMLAEESLPLFALGLSDVSPALTFRLNLDDKAEIVDVEILRSLVHVERLSYAEADEKAAEEELSPLFALADKLLAKRLASGAVSIDLPETHISVLDGKISIEAVQVYRSSEMVREFMLVAGVAASRWAMRKRVPFPFVAQELGDLPSQSLEGYAGSYQLRRCMRPRRLSSQPGRHGGLGLEEYTQVTSPLRRYTDLLAHQQIRAFLKGGPLLSTDEVLLRVAAGEIAAQASVQAERASRSHWTMVYLSEHKNSEWDAVVVERKGNRATVLIPSLGLETQLTVKGDPALNEGIRLSLNSVRIPELLVTFSSI
ncbi:hypothetical protein MASR2M78_28020 [Treponema sp.]